MKTPRRILIGIILLAFLTIASCTPVKETENIFKEANGFALGGLIQYKLLGSKENTELAFKEISLLLNELEEEFSANDQSSFLYSLSSNAYNSEIEISARFKEILDLAFDLSQISENRFTPLIGPLVKLWNIGFSDAKKPEKEKIEELIALVDQNNLIISQKEGKNFVSFKQSEMSLDLGAIVKGYAAQEALAICQRHNLKGALISINGNLAVFGQNIDNTPWRIGLIDPERESNDIIGSFSAENVTVATSGDYERYFIEDGILYHHILDAKTGYPAETDLKAVSIIAPEGALADGLSTVAFILGRERAIALLNSYEDLDYLLVDKDNRLWSKEEFKNRFIITNKNYLWGEVK